MSSLISKDLFHGSTFSYAYFVHNNSSIVDLQCPQLTSCFQIGSFFMVRGVVIFIQSRRILCNNYKEFFWGRGYCW